MSVNNKARTILRWAAITFVFVGYYLWLGFASLSFGHIHEKESMLFAEKVVTIEYHKASLAAMQEATSTVFDAALIGFPICVILILFIFKKVR